MPTFKPARDWATLYKEAKAEKIKDVAQYIADNTDHKEASQGGKFAPGFLSAVKAWVAQKEKTMKANEGRLPSKQTLAMKAMADKAEKEAAAEKAKKPAAKKKTNETVAVRGLARLMESELEKAQVIIAAKSILDKLQKMAEDLASTEADDIMPVLDSMRLTFGDELTDSFNSVTTAKIRQTMEAVKGAKEAITKEVGRLENNVNGEPTNDMSMDDDDFGDEAPTDMDDMGDGMGDMGDDTGSDIEVGDAEPEVDFDDAFDAAADDTAAGRAKKESIQYNILALRESADPDRLIFETFRRTLKETNDAVRSAKAVATAFSIDFQDVVSIIKEGKTYKDERGKTNKDKDRSQDRRSKKFERPSDLDEAAKDRAGGLNQVFGQGKRAAEQGKSLSDNKYEKGTPQNKEWAKGFNSVKNDVTEGKTYKDERGKTNKDKDRSQDRRSKKFERPSDMDECAIEEGKTRKDQKDRSDNPDKKDYSQARQNKKRDRPSDMDESKSFKAGDPRSTVNEWDMKPTPASKKGMFDGKTKAELHAEANKIKNDMKKYEDGGKTVPHSLRTKLAEINFALRAKNNWGKANESAPEDNFVKKTSRSEQRVKILGGMPEFIGKTGVIAGKEGSKYRVYLDKPVEIPGVGMVEDDLWAPKDLRKIKSVQESKGEYYSEKEGNDWCVFNTDDVGTKKSGHCFGKFDTEEEANEYCDEKNSSLKEGMPDFLKKREEYNDKAKKDRAAKGYTAMSTKK